MSATETHPKSINTRLNRIRLVSRIAKHICFVGLAFSVGFWLFFPTWTLPPGFKIGFAAGRMALMILLQVVLWFWYWKLTRLFHFYERGLIFAAETIRCIKILGLLFIAGWLITTTLHFFPVIAEHLHRQILVSPEGGWKVVDTSAHFFRMGFFSFDFGTGINFGQLMLGMMIVLVAWIMDKGRKIQEEQELTV